MFIKLNGKDTLRPNHEFREDKIANQIKDTCCDLFSIPRAAKIEILYKESRNYSVLYKLRVSFRDYPLTFFLKTPKYCDNDSLLAIEKEFYALETLFTKFDTNQYFNVAKPLAFLQNPPTLITEEILGTPFSRLMQSNTAFPISPQTVSLLSHYCSKCGHWLREFQTLSQDVPKTKYDLHRELTFIHKQADRCKKARLLPKNLVNSLHSCVEKLSLKIDFNSMPVSGMHGDFVFSNIIIHNESITVLDFTNFREGPTYRDMATFLYSLEKFFMNSFFATKILNTLKASFIDGFGHINETQDNIVFDLLFIREILGGLLQFSEHSKKTFLNFLNFKRLKSFSGKKLNEIINRYPILII